MSATETITLILAAIGGASGAWALFDRFIHRKPRLLLFAPFKMTGYDNGEKIFSVICKFANKSRVPAYLYPETLKVFLLKGCKWYEGENLLTHRKHLKTSLSEGQKLQSCFEKQASRRAPGKRKLKTKERLQQLSLTIKKRLRAVKRQLDFYVTTIKN